MAYDLPPQLDLFNICEGHVPEVFAHVLRQVMTNIQDPNTKAAKKRKLKIEFEFSPSEDRSHIEVEFRVVPGLQSIAAMKGSVFISRIDGEAKAYPRDPRQDVLFDASASASPKKQ